MNYAGLRAYKIQNVNHCSLMSIKKKRVKFTNWIWTNCWRENTMKILFSNEKMFNIDESYNSQNDRIWTVNRSAADTKGGIRKKWSFRKRLWFVSEFVLKVYPPLMIFEDGTMDDDRYIKEVLPVALKFGNDMFGTDWTFQQDSPRSHIHAKWQEWCVKHLPCFIDKDHWPPNSPDLKPFD